jgi:hemerythrin
MEPVEWSERFSVGVKELDQQHQQLIKLLNILISTRGTISPHSETVSDTLMAMTRYAQMHFKTEERLMETYGYPGLEEQKKQHRDFRKSTVDFSTAAYYGIDQVPEALLEYLVNWWVYHILEDDMAYRSFFKDKGVE